MISHKDNYQFFDENAVLELALVSVLGDRENQQDSSGYELKNEEGLVVLCDGMGGHEGGKVASTIATEHLLNGYVDAYPCENPHNLLIDLANESDAMIAELKNEDGSPMQAGSTLVSIYVQQDRLYWISVGDSRVYILRGEELVKITTDHTYGNVLDVQLRNNEITEEDYNGKIEKGEALVSFLGRNGLPYIDANDIPFTVQSGDKILLMSDGLYKLVPDDGIRTILLNFGNISEAVNALELRAQKNGKGKNRDNTTIAMIKIK